MQVVTEKLELPPLTLQNPDGKRLMTVDIGTTTIAMQLYDMTGKVVDSFPSVNPQVSYGADVLSRIEAAKDPGKAADMQKKVRDLMEKGVQRFSKKLQPQETLQMVVAANTTMTYLLMGWNPEELGKAPFTVSHSGAVETEIAGVACHIIPGLSAFVGGDITAGILASGMLEQEPPPCSSILEPTGRWHWETGTDYMPVPRRLALLSKAEPTGASGARIW